MKLDKNKLAELLNVSLVGLKTIERRNNLSKRLQKIGYNLIKKEKISRKVYYYIELINSNKQLINSICKYYFNTSKSDEFAIYFKERTDYSKKDLPATLEYLASKSNVNPSTIYKWDFKLLNKKIISKDGFFYFKLNKDKQTIEEVTKEEYNSFWRNKGRLKLYNMLQNRYLKGEITFAEALEISDNATALMLELEDRYLYRIKRYKLNKDNMFYLDFIDLIKEEVNED